VQQHAPLSAQEALKRLTNATGAEPVAATGRKFVLYRPKPENPVIQV
jgi:RNA-binding protein YhbY